MFEERSWGGQGFQQAATCSRHRATAPRGLGWRGHEALRFCRGGTVEGNQTTRTWRGGEREREMRRRSDAVSDKKTLEDSSLPPPPLPGPGGRRGGPHRFLDNAAPDPRGSTCGLQCGHHKPEIRI